MSQSTLRLQRAAQILFYYTLLVILWGAWVRISHSGDGCGESWPLCHGQLVPSAGAGKTWVEYSHRAMSGIYGIFVFVLWWQVRRAFPRGHVARSAALGVLILTVTEALLGAKLVLFGLVNTNSSWGRTLAMSLHQVNSLLLTGSVVILFFALRDGALTSARRWRGLVVGVFLLISVTGAWAALAGTLFPSESLREGLLKDFSEASHHLLRLRILHPLAALLGGGGMALYFWMKSQVGTESVLMRQRALQTSLVLVGAIVFGLLTLFLLSPSWMRLTHLAIAHMTWAMLVRWAVTTDRSSAA